MCQLLGREAPSTSPPPWFPRALCDGTGQGRVWRARLGTEAPVASLAPAGSHPAPLPRSSPRSQNLNRGEASAGPGGFSTSPEEVAPAPRARAWQAQKSLFILPVLFLVWRRSSVRHRRPTSSKAAVGPHPGAALCSFVPFIPVLFKNTFLRVSAESFSSSSSSSS